MLQETYLVLSATGRQGSAVVDALVAKNANVFGSSRNPESLRKKRGDTIGVVHADMSDTASIVRALDKSKATRVWFTTDWYSISKPTRAKEARLGYNVIDAVKRRSGQVRHVVFNSGVGVGVADGPRMGEFQSKADIESYMARELASVQVTWSVLRPVAFMENLDDDKNGNPLRKGSVKMLSKPGYPVKYVSCADIGKGSAALLSNPGLYKGRKIDAATGAYTGPELAAALSKASGVACKYSMSVPRFVLYLFVGDLYKLVTWIEGGGYDGVDTESFRKIVPDCQDAQAWFAAKGQWADGEKFSN